MWYRIRNLIFRQSTLPFIDAGCVPLFQGRRDVWSFFAFWMDAGLQAASVGRRG